MLQNIDHVKTQMPYAVLVAVVAVVVGYIPAGFNVHWIFSIVIGIVMIYAFHRYMAKPVALSEVKAEHPENAAA